jgi:hypothetical protein
MKDKKSQPPKNTRRFHYELSVKDFDYAAITFLDSSGNLLLNVSYARDTKSESPKGTISILHQKPGFQTGIKSEVEE